MAKQTRRSAKQHHLERVTFGTSPLLVTSMKLGGSVKSSAARRSSALSGAEWNDSVAALIVSVTFVPLNAVLVVHAHVGGELAVEGRARRGANLRRVEGTEERRHRDPAVGLARRTRRLSAPSAADDRRPADNRAEGDTVQHHPVAAGIAADVARRDPQRLSAALTETCGCARCYPGDRSRYMGW